MSQNGLLESWNQTGSDESASSQGSQSNSIQLCTSVKSLYVSPNLKFSERAIKDLLKFLSSDDIFSLATTATSKKLLPENLEEAIDMILLYTPDIDRFFSYRRITSQVLTLYLYKHGLQLKGHATREQLISHVKNIWVQNFPKESSGVLSREKVASSHSEIVNPYNNEIVDPVRININIEMNVNQNNKISSTVFAHDYAKWFYSLLNSINENYSISNRNIMTSSIFCANSSLNAFLLSPSNRKEINCQGSEECVKSLYNIVEQHKLSFSPNVENGIQAHQSAHGLVKVFCCGTLHVAASFIGIFEQEFGLVKNPIDKSWQIFYTKINLKEAVSDLPALPSSPVFEIDNT